MKFMKKLIFFFFLQISIVFNLITSSEPSCNISNCPTNYGECLDDICLCAAGYTTTALNYNLLTITNQQSSSNTNSFCNYPFKYKEYAANLEAIFPFGVGHFYSSRYLHASIKFFLFWFLSFSKVLFKKRIRLSFILEKAVLFGKWVFAVIYLIDFLSFTFNYYKDGNGIILLE